MSILWPESQNADATAIVRLGRVLHWAATVITALWLLGCVCGGLTTKDGGIGGAAFTVLVALVFGAPIYFAGRGARYILSGE